MTSRILGVVREQVLAYYFGAGTAMDALQVAYRFPNLLRDLFAEGAMSAAFVPTFASELKILEEYQPPAASAEEIAAAVAAAIAETGATTPKDMGKVMKAVMPKLAGKSADGRAVNEAVRRALGA